MHASKYQEIKVYIMNCCGVLIANRN